MKITLRFLALITAAGMLFTAGSAGAQVPPDDEEDTTVSKDESVVILTPVDEFSVPLATVQLEGATLILPFDIAAAVCDVTVASLNDQVEDEGGASCVPTIETGTAALTDDDILVSLQIEGSTIQVPLDLAADLCDRDIATLRQDLNGGDVTCNTASAVITTTGGTP